MKKSDDPRKEPGGCQAVGFPEADKEWQAPCLTLWEVARDTSMGVINDKTGSGADTHGMRDVTLSG